MRLAFIIPRYGLDILGGAESHARGFAERLVQEGWDIEVWTSCARDYHTWQNVYPAGIEIINGVIVYRFPTWINRPPAPQKQHLKSISNFPATPEAEYSWADEGMHSPKLYHHLIQHGQELDYLIFMPYSFGFTHYSASIYPERSVIWPLLHEEVVAYFMPVRVMLNQARGILLNGQAEKRLLEQQLLINHPRCQVIAGYGVEPIYGDARRFYQRYPQLNGPFILYAGRLEKAKNVHVLIDYFVQYAEAENRQISLVLIGSGPVSVPRHPRIFSLGFLSEQDKHDAYAAAIALCQPSVYESFGITLIEAWLHETPVLVHRDCQVTVEHCLTAQGGLYFQDSFEFGGVLDFLLNHPKIARQMGQNGKVYVETNYNWNKLIKQLTSTLTAWQAIE